jgi:hypothetical protein
VNDIENQVDVTVEDPSQQQGQQMSDIQQMLAQFQQQMMAQFQKQQKELQNVFPVLADAQCETDRCLSDVIAGGARGRGRETPPAPFASAAVAPVPPVAKVNVQSQLHPLRQF